MLGLTHAMTVVASSRNFQYSIRVGIKREKVYKMIILNYN